MTAQRKYRAAPRKDVQPLTLDGFSSLESLQKLAKSGEVVEASSTGILLKFKRDDFVDKTLRSNLSIDQLVGQSVYFNIHEMNLEISGKVARTKFLGKKEGYLVAVDYSADAPEYWRECLMDLLPAG
ncbi:MAG: hypothetical protein H7061_00450 [Bdellovibrionaceae bacterium]|nr:hypothetical protein [Bdellovibrio sp.]